MKSLIAVVWAFAFLMFCAKGSIIADGKGFFPVMVQVVNPDSGSPIKGAILHLENAGSYKETELDPRRRTKILPDSLGKAIATNEQGVAVAFYYGGWSTVTKGGVTSFTVTHDVIVVVEYEGKEIFRSSLKAWAEKNDFKERSKAVPWIIVQCPKTVSKSP